MPYARCSDTHSLQYFWHVTWHVLAQGPQLIWAGRGQRTSHGADVRPSDVDRGGCVGARWRPRLKMQKVEKARKAREANGHPQRG